MKNCFKKSMGIFLCGTLLLGVFSACGAPTSSAPASSMMTPSSTTDSKAEMESAQVGGKLVIYSPNSEGIMNNIIPAFQDKYGIEVEIISAGAGELIKRLLSETNDPYADIDFGGVNYSIYKQNPDLFEQYVSPNDKNLPKEYQNTTGFYTNYTLNGSCMLVNKTLAKDLKIESYEDLLNPALKGTIATGDPANSSSAFAQLTNVLIAKGGYEDDKAWSFVENLIKQWDGKVLSSSSAVYKGVADGEYTVGMTYEDPCATLLESGADVQVVYPKEGAVFLPSGAAIIKGSKNIDNAKLFIDFLISEECQKIFGEKLTNRPILESVKPKNLPALGEISTAQEDISYIADHKEDITSRYKDLFAKLQ